MTQFRQPAISKADVLHDVKRSQKCGTTGYVKGITEVLFEGT